VDTLSAAEFRKRYGRDPERAPRRSKYHVAAKEARTVDGITFDSKREALHYQKLKAERERGDILFFLRQVPFHLPGGVRYVVDFLVVDLGGKVSFEDVKGYRTREYVTKKKLVEALYPVKIVEV
jgi:hypothetical protein